MTPRKPTPDALFEWALAWQAGPRGDVGWGAPTLKDAAQHYGITLREIEALIRDYQGDGYFGVAVGMACGSGHYSFTKRADYLIEAYR